MKKSVLFIVQNLPVPDDRRVWMEAIALKKNGFKISIIAPGKPDQKKKEEIDGVAVFRYRRAPKSTGYPSYLWEYVYSLAWTFYLTWKIYLTRNFSVIHTANPPDFMFLIALMFRPLGVKFVYDQHDLMPEMLLVKFDKNRKSLLYKILAILERLSYKFCDAHISTCQSGLSVILKRVKSKNKSFIVRTAPNPAISNKNLIDQKKAQDLKNKFKYLASYIGVMGPQDGVDKLLRSISIIKHKIGRTDIGFILMGDGDDFERLKKMAKSLDIDDQVIFTGWADKKDMATYLSISHIGLMPEPKNDYTDNSLHNKILEYMSVGLPVLAYNLKEARNVAGEAAIYICGNDENKYAEGIINLLNDPGAREKMGSSAKNRVNNYTQDLSESELLKVYVSFGY